MLNSYSLKRGYTLSGQVFGYSGRVIIKTEYFTIKSITMHTIRKIIPRLALTLWLVFIAMYDVRAEGIEKPVDVYTLNGRVFGFFFGKQLEVHGH